MGFVHAVFGPSPPVLHSSRLQEKVCGGWVGDFAKPEPSLRRFLDPRRSLALIIGSGYFYIDSQAAMMKSVG